MSILPMKTAHQSLLSASELAARLRISEDEILLLLLSGLLACERRGGALFVAPRELETFAIAVASGLKKGEDFHQGLRRLLHWLRESLAGDQATPSGFDLELAHSLQALERFYNLSLKELDPLRPDERPSAPPRAAKPSPSKADEAFAAPQVQPPKTGKLKARRKRQQSHPRDQDQGAEAKKRESRRASGSWRAPVAAEKTKRPKAPAPSLAQPPPSIPDAPSGSPPLPRAFAAPPRTPPPAFGGLSSGADPFAAVPPPPRPRAFATPPRSPPAAFGGLSSGADPFAGAPPPAPIIIPPMPAPGGASNFKAGELAERHPQPSSARGRRSRMKPLSEPQNANAGVSALAAMKSDAAAQEEIEVEEVTRRSTVRYYRQMYLERSYPLFVVISQHKIKRMVSMLVDQVSSKQAFKVKASNPIVRIRPILPGCLCIPAEIDLDVSERIASSEFWLTPTAAGELKGARVEVLYEGKVVDTLRLDVRATTQGFAKLSGSLAFVTSTLGPSLQSFGLDLQREGAELLGSALSWIGSSYGPYVSSSVLALLTVSAYLWNRPREAPPLESFFDYEADNTPAGDPLVIAQRCRLLLLSRSARQGFELVETGTLIGRSSECPITLHESSVCPRHAEICFDPDRELFSVEPRGGRLSVDGLEVSSSHALRRDAVIALSGQVTLWFYDERQDPEGLDHPANRKRVEAALVGAMPSFDGEIRAAFQKPMTTRAALAALMLEGLLTPSLWSLIKTANEL